MKINRLAIIVLLGAVLLAGVACGEGQGAEPTPTPTVTLTPAAIATPTPTPTSTMDLSFCPPPAEGKANIAGRLTWNGESYYDEFRVRGVVEMLVYGDWLEIEGVKYTEGTVLGRDSTDIDGYFCFRNVEPEEYMVRKKCPAGTKELMYVLYGPILAQAGQTKWVDVDPYTVCMD